jgi:FKBP-type peptidyl-prolyl cis-trans isomerase
MTTKSKTRAAWAAASLAVIAALLVPLLAQTSPASAPASPASTASAPPAGLAPGMPAEPPPMDLSKVSADDVKSYLKTFGWVIGQQMHLKQLGLTPEEVDQFAAGLKLVSTTGPDDIPGGADNWTKTKDYLTARAEKVHDADLATQTAANDKFFADLAKDPSVKKTDDGLYYKIITPGGDPKPKSTDTVTVKYTGKLLDGTVFDKTDDKDPAGPTRDMALENVIKGWTEGLQLIGKGGEIMLYIPAKLAYGDDPDVPLPPGAALIFDTTVVDFKPTPPPDASASGLDGLSPEMLQKLQSMQGSPGGSPPASTSK